MNSDGSVKKKNSTMLETNIWTKGLLFCPSVPVPFQIYGYILVLAPPRCLSTYLFVGCRGDAMLARRVCSLSVHLSAVISQHAHTTDKPVCVYMWTGVLFKTHPVSSSL